MDYEDNSRGITVFKNRGIAVDSQLREDQIRALERYCDYKDYNIRLILQWDRTKTHTDPFDILKASEILQDRLFKEWVSWNNDSIQAIVKSIFEKRDHNHYEIPYDMLKDTVQEIYKAESSGVNIEDHISGLEKYSNLDFLTWLRKNRSFNFAPMKK
ncbi:hypothetical protein [Paenibacillus sp. HW567]|uniref:hypothetical protein n=1 Tax=Paenibacillus sp. HW567 TaxID=1034769 RepID=UPI0003720EBC|nr:hypothetical protein [Paenibacillus sp. HW567]